MDIAIAFIFCFLLLIYSSFKGIFVGYAIIIAPLIPWNIAALVPLSTLNAEASSIFYAFYLYLIPIINLIYFKLIIKRKNFRWKRAFN